ncbi:hypothetical protein JVT61DRAFT_13803 [Boletus reticuloceps]|uniref:G domain-containing protein n=1 Tax=Boletus reticuloceps TaxID=495285 RepID=A0A8I2YWE3_9AGAM|nr:hypothetical protein JVT61DRAFT_13803 [Boletus reticuloceps]
MYRSDHGSFAHLTSPSSSRPTLQDHSPQPTSMAASNILFLGETNIGEYSIIDLIAGQAEQSRTPRHAGHRDDVRSITLDGKLFMLHTLPTNASMSPAVLTEGIQNTLTDLRRNGGVHLIVYCMHASHSTSWILEIHRTILFYPTPLLRIPAVAVVSGMSDVAQQESWWSSNEDAFVEQGFRFDDHAFIRMMATTVQSPTGDCISESRHILHALILQNCAYPLNSETDSDFQRTAPYKQRFMANSFQSLLTLLGGKPPSHTSTGSKAIDIVLLGEIGVGKNTVGCTRTAVKYTFEEKGKTFHLYDTPGLVDPQMGVELFIDPIDSIQKLIRSLGNGNGPDLLLFCVENGKPTTALRRNYRLFCKVICEGKASFALAITKLEEGEDADQWWRRHRATIRRAQPGLGRKVERVAFFVLYRMHGSTEEQDELATFLDGAHGRFGYYILTCTSVDTGEGVDESMRIGRADC